jgi:parallel beta-helix repeat protein
MDDDATIQPWRPNMNLIRAERTAAVIGFVACLVVFGEASAGSLTPPGPPAPTMKPLDQVEPRTPIVSLPFLINAPGSYYLTGNLQGVSGAQGITVNADHVTIDLNGFALTGVVGAGSGIYTGNTPSRNLTIRNGTVRDWPVLGISAEHSLNVLFEDLLVSGNGFDGVMAGAGVIRQVLTRANGSRGIALQDLTGGTIEDCQAIENVDTGIVIYYNGIVTNNNVYHNGGFGILAAYTGSRVEANHVVSSGNPGIFVNGTGNVIIRNTAIANAGGNYNIAPGNDAGPVGTAATATSPWANISD